MYDNVFCLIPLHIEVNHWCVFLRSIVILNKDVEQRSYDVEHVARADNNKAQ